MSFHRSNLQNGGNFPAQDNNNNNDTRPTQRQRALTTLKQRCSFGSTGNSGGSNKKKYSSITDNYNGKSIEGARPSATFLSKTRSEDFYHSSNLSSPSPLSSSSHLNSYSYSPSQSQSQSLSRPLYSRANTTSRAARPISTGYLLGDDSDSETSTETMFSRRRMKPETKPAFNNLKLCVLRAIGLKNNNLS
ncbi:hypothetical protein J3Q64DRAFT_1704778 [Phycomyces blakesleeanus]|uniref:Uncharacterized protein n=2 Tax=Phycomyces blakesleeanus TaxID=4837 RepID=A0A162T5S1_PHYB8|nr:hypothetical protein PHYBLDRAFT_175253 [Phycomyces blakesleeanus NRRL 1555(-)]OAD66442.1 hypothetical protein PHYBLDRAFT_175253 [Phycomyces blakesleeanus NRRL 1555(-)]|eukprot:XP_018284482.1 hypothetical protein PHYBLDRAFT_175253 [Phycomyces blakesleeanus NRRL 1555(-)]